jgi:hypothetical protein
MAVEIQLDEITRSTFEADSRVIRYLQHGVAKNLTETDPSKILARLPDLSGFNPAGNPVQIPKLGTAHKVYPHCLVTGYRVSGIGSFDVDFFIVYETPAGFGLNFQMGVWYPFRSNSISEIETWLDIENYPIEVQYKPPGAGTSIHRLSSARRRIAHTDLMLTGVFYEDVTTAQENAVGKINALKWYRKPPGTWLCSGCNSSPEIFGLTWRKTATFIYSPVTWDAFEKFVDPNTGQSPIDIKKTDVDFLVNVWGRFRPADLPTNSQSRRNGVTRARVQQSVNFETAFGIE